MSGGSYGYLYRKDAEEVIAARSTLEAMVERLEDIDPRSTAAQDARAMLESIDATMKLVGEQTEALADVFHAVEWWASGDSGEADAREAIRRYDARRKTVGR